WICRPAILGAMSMNCAAPSRCRASPLIAWMAPGTSIAACALSLLAVTVISSRDAAPAAGCVAAGGASAATAGPPVSSAATPVVAADNNRASARDTDTCACINPSLVRAARLRALQYDLSYEISNLGLKHQGLKHRAARARDHS